jgi:hypothetical protein
MPCAMTLLFNIEDKEVLNKLSCVLSINGVESTLYIYIYIYIYIYVFGLAIALGTLIHHHLGYNKLGFFLG